jgi:hypothetical protein
MPVDIKTSISISKDGKLWFWLIINL